MKPKHIAMLLLLYLFAPGSIVFGETVDKDLQTQLEKELKNKPLIIRNFYADNTLEFDSDGKLKSGGSPGIWTINGYYRPGKIKLSKKQIVLEGERLYWIYDYDASKESLLRCSLNTTIRIAREPEHNTFPSTAALLRKVFLASNEPLEDHVPVYWKNLVKTKFQSATRNLREEMDEIKRSNAGIENPRVLFNPKPSYTEEARGVRLAGVMAMRVVIDEEGKAAVQEILRPLGAGLDESAIKTCETWKFAPGLLNGKPVRVIAVVEVSFRLH